MTSPLLETKFHLPLGRPGLVHRPRLHDRLTRGVTSALTVVAAPAGFGKSTLLAEWVATQEHCAVAWVSLDHRDNNPVLFWTYLAAALQAAAPGIGPSALALLRSPQPPIDAVLATLLNDLGAADNDVVLVLDDYHLIDTREIHDEMTFLLEHLPRQAHLVLAGRADPALPLARLRGRGQLVEIRSADLRFRPDEATAYLTEVMGLAMTEADVVALEGRTEGWIAALQMAALSLQGRDDVAGFIAGFAGDDRYIVDYLAEEVLERQPERVRQFLLHTAILDRLSGPLCDAVTGESGGKARLAELERANLFLVPLDDRRQWYRYHQLFADVLLAHLLDEQPAELSVLHLRASTWFADNGDAAEAIRHALAGKDFNLAADLVELAIAAMRRNRQEATVHGWLAMLPDDVVAVRPVLLVGSAGVLLAIGDMAGVEDRLAAAQRWLDSDAAPGAASPGTGPASGMVVVDHEELNRLPETMELYRAALALGRGDVPGAVRHAGGARELAAAEDHLGRAAAAGLLGIAHWAGGDLAAGYSAYAECMAGLYLAGHVADTFGCAIALADIRLAQGRLEDAMGGYQEALRRAAAAGGGVLRGTADMYVGMSGVHRERGDLSAAARDLLRSQELGGHLGLPQNPYRWRVASAGVRQADGDLSGAVEQLDDAERVYVGDYFPNVRPIPALRVRVWLEQGRLAEAIGWATERGLSVDDDLSYLSEFEHITLARVLLARHRHQQEDSSLRDATLVLARLLSAAEDGGRIGSVIEILVLQALAAAAGGDVHGALAPLRRALALAEPQGYVRIFVDDGQPMAALLRAAVQQGIAPGYADRLLDILTPPTGRSPAPQPAAPPVSSRPQGLIAPLSARELDVLRLLGSDLDGPEIARELIVSLNTVRTHTKNIYAKLGVNNRRAAIRRAQELDLMSQTRRRG